MHLTAEEYTAFKAMCDKEGIKYNSEAEYREAAYNLTNFIGLLYEMGKEEHLREKRLEEEPKGFNIPSEGRTCFVCYKCVYGEIWYDKWGLKCANCQAAFKEGVFPGYILKDKNNRRHVTASQLNWRHKIHPQTIKKLVRLGKLKARQVPDGPTIFLRAENPDLPSVIEEYAKD